MLGNCEKMLLISPTANEWPQNHHHHQIIDEKGMNKMSSSTANNNRAMEKLAPPSQDQQQHGLKCPRCDSSNTKFCYYNNYSLSQPRHFCKACKRYWTRGGTLRNVPVGGGCRKNKRVKRPSSSSSSSAIDAPSSAATTNTSNPILGQPQIDISSTHMNPLFYGLLPNNPSDLNLPFSRVSASGYDLHHQPAQLSGLGLGFSSSGIDDYRNGFNLSSTSNSPLVSNYNNNSSMFGPNSSSFSTASTPTMASLLAFSSLHHQYKLTPKETLFPTNHLHTLMPFEDMQIGGNNGDQAEPAPAKEVKVEGGQNRLDNWSAHSQNQMEQIGSSDPSSLYWNTTNNNVGANWPDLPNIGSSVTSLI